MRIEILANDRASFIKPMAEGLGRMLSSLGATSRVHYDGIAQLMRTQSVDTSSFRSLVGSSGRLLSNRRHFAQFVEDMRGADAIVVVSNVPGCFSPTLLPNIEQLRKKLPGIPIVNYDLHYLPTLDSWARVLLRDEKTKLSAEDLKIFSKGKFGLERYDWYLMAAVSTPIPIPAGPQPFSLIGLDLDDGSLFPEQGSEFRVLLDFEQPRADYPRYRRVQLEALRIAGLAYEILEGSYSREEICAIYRKSSVLLLASAEAFGLPICEVQACGALVFLPDAYWASGHWLGTDYHNVREPRLSSNFVVYEDSPERLAAELQQAARAMNPARVREVFLDLQPELFHGNRDELADFLGMLESGKIHSGLHGSHRQIGRAP